MDSVPLLTGIAFKGNTFGPKEAQQTLDTNFLGTKAVCEAVKPMMVKGGRIVNVCSMAGKLRIIKSPKLVQRFQVSSSFPSCSCTSVLLPHELSRLP